MRALRLPPSDRLANGVKEGASFKPEDFSSVESKIKAIAPSLYTITSNNQVVPLRTAHVQLSVEEDVEFVLITCFTLAHSLTLALALASLDIIAIPSRIVEPLIAASIVFVALENIFCRTEPKGRLALTFAFGLIHGFGFASILRDRFSIGADGNSLVVPLFSFNLGVELGQLLVATLLLPFFLKLRENKTFSGIGVRAVSVVIAALGAYWLLQRTVFS